MANRERGGTSGSAHAREMLIKKWRREGKLAPVEAEAAQQLALCDIARFRLIDRTLKVN